MQTRKIKRKSLFFRSNKRMRLLPHYSYSNFHSVIIFASIYSAPSLTIFSIKPTVTQPTNCFTVSRGNNKIITRRKFNEKFKNPPSLNARKQVFAHTLLYYKDRTRLFIVIKTTRRELCIRLFQQNTKVARATSKKKLHHSRNSTPSACDV